MVKRQGFRVALVGQQPGQRLPPSLELMNRAGLFAVFIDRQHEAAVEDWMLGRVLRRQKPGPKRESKRQLRMLSLELL